MREFKQQPRVLVIGPGPKVRGGITSVVLAHATTACWNEWRCAWLNTHDDASALRKIAQALAAIVLAPFAISRARIVHIHLAGGTSAVRKVPFAALASMLGRRLVIHFHAPSPDWIFDRTPAWVLRFLVSRADVVIALSPYWEREFTRRWPDKRIEVVPNPVTGCVSQYVEKASGVILYLGKVEERKGYADLLAAFASIAGDAPNAQLWFAGHGELERAGALARELGIADRVRFLNWVRGDAKEKALSEAEVFCLPTYAEGVPVSMLEAMAHGLPVITTPVGGIPDIIEDGKNGLLVSPGDREALALRLLLVLQNATLRRGLGSEALRTVNEHYRARQVGQRLSHIYRTLTVESPSQQHAKHNTKEAY